MRGGDLGDCFGDGSQVADVLGRVGGGVELVKPRLGLGSGLLKLFTSTGHRHHLSEVAVELGAEHVGVDCDGVVIGVEDDDFEQAPVAVGAYEEDSVEAGNGTQGVAGGVEDVLSEMPCLRALSAIFTTQVTLSNENRQGNLPKRHPDGRRPHRRELAQRR